MSHAPRSAAGRHLRPLVIAFAMVAVFMVVEVVVGVISGSLALVSDAGHMATDALGLGMAIAAVLAGSRAPGANTGRTYGSYRLEILAALANAVLLLGVAFYVIWEAVSRLSDPTPVMVAPMLVVAVVGLGVNVAAWRLLGVGADESLNVKGARTEVLADLIGSIGVIVAGLVTVVTGWMYADPLVAGVIAVFIVPRAWRLGADALRILVQAAPRGMDLNEVETALSGIPGVVDVHDLHVWTLTDDMEVASAHLSIGDDDDPHPVLDHAREILEDRFGIDHATLQVEPRSHRSCVETTW